MKFILLAAVAILTACTSLPADFRPVLTERHSEELRALPPAPGFTVTPFQADSAVRKARLLPEKVIYDIYADSSYYYVCNAFWWCRRSEAFTRGVRVDGHTGQIVARPK